MSLFIFHFSFSIFHYQHHVTLNPNPNPIRRLTRQPSRRRARFPSRKNRPSPRQRTLHVHRLWNHQRLPRRLRLRPNGHTPRHCHARPKTRFRAQDCPFQNHPRICRTNWRPVPTTLRGPTLRRRRARQPCKRIPSTGHQITQNVRQTHR